MTGNRNSAAAYDVKVIRRTFKLVLRLYLTLDKSLQLSAKGSGRYKRSK